MTEHARLSVRLTGTVQGVGFRPHVHATATALQLAGFVGNDGEGVFVEVEGPPGPLSIFEARIVDRAPPLATIETVTVRRIDVRGDRGFRIVDSPHGSPRRTAVPPDVATCDACLAELRDPTDRRYRYPFTNCTDCGPRFTITTDVPYDRPSTTMAEFRLCDDCRAEYEDPTDRRFHAQPVCCPACGPTTTLVDHTRSVVASADAAVTDAVAALRAGHVVAVKGLGGFHLAAVASDERAVATLRSRKHREDRPFAVMVGDVAAAAVRCHIGAEEAAQLTDRARPIVLLTRRADAPVADAVAPGNRALGVMLPYTPLHHLLLDGLGEPIVLTSGNVSQEPIVHRDREVGDRLAGIADLILTHDRPIHVRTDDSVVQVVGGRARPLRRSRGYAPAPIRLPVVGPRPVLAVGGELKSTICVTRGHRAFVSQHIGDLENFETFASFLETIDHMERLADVAPRVVAHDLHPEYLSTKHAVELAADEAVELVGVQHHHAHIAACLADNGRTDAVIGVAFDGTGYGADGTVWGGEVLVADLTASHRVGRLTPLGMPGGAAAIRQPWRMALAHLHAAGVDVDDLDVAARNRERWDAVRAVVRSRINSPLTSSAGRLFDAVASILGVRDHITYEGQAAIELEQLAGTAVASEAYDAGVTTDDDGLLAMSAGDLVRAVVADLRDGVDRRTVAARFHTGVADLVVRTCTRVASERDLGTVALSGGVFQNVLLTEQVERGLAGAGLEVLTHRSVPPNDGGISFGQAAVAVARDLAAGR